MKHASHAPIAKRLKRAEGHLSKVIEMIESGRPCLDIAQQMQAVESAIRNAKTTLIHDHVAHCLTEAVQNEEDRDDKLTEFQEIARYL